MRSVGPDLLSMLPEFYLAHDQNEELRAFLSVLQEGVDLVASDLEALYGDLFIETCGSDVIEHIAALVGLRMPFDRLPPDGGRAMVADALRLRQIKGTVGAVAGSCTAASGWQSLAVDRGTLLGEYEDSDFIRLRSGRLADVKSDGSRRPEEASDSDEASAALLRPSFGAGAAGPTSVEVVVWTRTWRAFDDSELRFVADGKYTFSPFGVDTPVRLESGIRPSETVDPASVLRSSENNTLLTSAGPRFVVRVGESQLLPGQVVACDLSDWQWPTGNGSAVALVDLERGRLMLAPGRADPHDPRVRVDHWCAFGGPIGGGFTSRPPDRAVGPHAEVLVRDVHRDVGEYVSLRRALKDLPIGPSSSTTIRVHGNALFAIGTATVILGSGDHLRIQAIGGRPSILGNLVVEGPSDARVSIEGMCVSGSIRVTRGATIELVGSTIWPDPGTGPSAGEIAGCDCEGDVTIRSSIIGGIRVHGSLRAIDSIIDGDGVAARVDDVLIAERTTILGTISARHITNVSSLLPTIPGRTPQVVFASRRFGDSGYALPLVSEASVMTGGDGGSELGAFNSERRWERLAAVRRAAVGQVPFGFDIEVTPIP